MTSYNASEIKKQGKNLVITFERVEQEAYVKMPAELTLSLPLEDLKAFLPAPKVEAKKAEEKPAEAPKPAPKVEAPKKQEEAKKTEDKPVEAPKPADK
jgi:hypothetical protein